MPELLFIVDQASKQLTPVTPVAFADIGVKERQDLENWVVSHPVVLGEELLVVTTEFDRFGRSDRRLDVLALDKKGCLLVVELKLDLSGSFADQQAIRYAAFCSTMTMEQVVSALAAYEQCSDEDAQQRILMFLDADELPQLDDQPRIILAAGSLDDEELTSTVLWLRSFGVDITCVEMKPYRLPDTGTLVLVPRVIIPLPEAKDYLVRVEQKQVAKVQKSKETSRTGKLWEAIAAKFDVSDLGITNQPRPTMSYMQLRVGYANFHYEWDPRKRDRILRVAIHLEASDRALNQRHLQKIIEHRDEIVKGIDYPFVTEVWGQKWATAEFRLPCDDTVPLESFAAEASRVMRLLVERTWPFMEPILKDERAQHPQPNE